jgi:hypothetical protein
LAGAVVALLCVVPMLAFALYDTTHASKRAEPWKQDRPVMNEAEFDRLYPKVEELPPFVQRPAYRSR